jgi:hypothetical protein
LLAVVVGIAAGATLAALAGARRADSAVTRFVAYSHPAHGVVQADPGLYDEITGLPQVAATARVARMLMARLDPAGQPDRTLALGEIAVDDLAFNRPIVVAGRTPRADSVTEVAVNPSAAKNGHLKVGSSFRLRAYDPGKAEDLLRGVDTAPTGPTVTLKVVGIQRFPVDLNVAQAAPGVSYASADNVFLTPAFFHTYVDRVAVAGGVYLSFRLKGGPAGMASFQDDVGRLSGGRASVFPGSDDVDAAVKASRATRVEALALLVFAILAALVTLTLIAQALARQVHLDGAEYPVLRAVGMTRRQLVTVAAIRAAIVAVGGVALAVGVAVGLSPRTPIGLAREAEIHRGYSVDALVFATGALAVLVVLTGWAALVAWRAAAVAGLSQVGKTRPSLVDRALNRASLPPSAAVGAGMALEAGRGPTAVPVRTMLTSAVLAVVVVVGALTFGANLTNLAEHPGLQGWNWDVAVGNPHSDDVAAAAVPLLSHNPDIAELTEVAVAESGIPARIDGHGTALFGMDAVRGSALPPYTAGRPPRGVEEIAFGAKTLEALHRRIGDRVTVSTGGPPRSLVITGRLVLTPSVVNDSVALGQASLMTVEGLRALGVDAPVSVFLVRFVPRTDRAAALQRLRGDFPGTVLSASRPPDVENLRRVDRLPTLLAVLFGLVALLTVGHGLVSSVRRRGHDLVLLRAMGFTGRQVSAAVAWQATIVAMVAIAVGLPLGVAAGRWAWTLVTDQLGLVPVSAAPGLMLLLVGLLSLAAANLVAIVPGLMATRTRPATILHRE